MELGGNGSKRTSAYVDELETGRGTGRLMPKKPEWMDAGKAGTRLRIYLAHLDSTLSSKTKWAMCEFKWRPWMLIDIGYFQVWRLHSGRFHTLIVHVQQMRSLTRHILGVKGHSRFLYKTRLYKQYGMELTLVRLSLVWTDSQGLPTPLKTRVLHSTFR